MRQRVRDNFQNVVIEGFSETVTFEVRPEARRAMGRTDESVSGKRKSKWEDLDA